MRIRWATNAEPKYFSQAVSEAYEYLTTDQTLGYLASIAEHKIELDYLVDDQNKVLKDKRLRTMYVINFWFDLTEQDYLALLLKEPVFNENLRLGVYE